MSIDNIKEADNRRESIREWQDFSLYVSKYRYNSYWHQLDEVFRSKAENILEVEVGAGVTYNYLQSKGHDVYAVDLEVALKPTVAATVMSLPFRDKTFDAVVCCQVLEHLPFEKFKDALCELHRVCAGKLILSLPDKTLGIALLIRVPNFIFWDCCIFLPWAIREPIRTVREHYWEIGRKGFPKKKIIANIQASGFSLERTYRVPEYPYHHFFIASV